MVVKLQCDLCGKPNPYWYQVRDIIWKEAKLLAHHQVCLPCLSKALKRNIILDDFEECPLNITLFYMFGEQSKVAECNKIFRRGIKCQH